MRLLAIDTAANLCAACVWDTDAGERGRTALDLGKGHAEHLIGVIDAALQAAGIDYGDLDAIAVSVGPGSFTGVRVGVATARGLALALDLPVIGISTLEALAFQAQQDNPGLAAIARIEAGRGQVYLAAFAGDGAPAKEPVAMSLAMADEFIASAGPGVLLATGTTADIAAYARLAAQKLAADPGPGPSKPKPKPLYLREADAKPQDDFALPRKAFP